MEDARIRLSPVRVVEVVHGSQLQIGGTTV